MTFQSDKMDINITEPEWDVLDQLEQAICSVGCGKCPFRRDNGCIGREFFLTLEKSSNYVTSFCELFKK